MQNQLDEFYIARCFELARQGLGTASPNPLVGCVVVKNGAVLAEGHHAKWGQAHAEADAISKVCDQDLVGSTVYCNLEPCSHTKKKTPPCADLLIAKKIARVVVSNVDPNPEVSGRGLEKIKQAGLEVVDGVLSSEGQKLNEVFFKWMRTGLPFVHLKVAQTLDGYISSIEGDSKWISDVGARTQVHEMRLQYDAVMVGRGTLNQDNPSLTIRLVDSKGKTPYRIIVGTLSKMNLDATVFQSHLEKLVIIGTQDNDQELKQLERKGVHFIELPKDPNREDWLKAFRDLGKMGISSILVEGGPRLLSDIIENELYDRLTVYSCPLLLGQGKSFYESDKLKIKESKKLNLDRVQRLGDQVRLDYSVGGN